MYLYIYVYTYIGVYICVYNNIIRWKLSIEIITNEIISAFTNCRACAASDMGLSASVPLPIVMGIFVLLGFQSS